MIKIGSRTGHKIGILLVLTTLAIGSAAAINIEYPSSNTGVLTGSFDLNVSGDGTGSYDIWRNYDGLWISEGSTSGNTSIGNTNWGPGTHTIKVNNTTNGPASVDIEIDNEVPTKSSNAFTPSSNEYISSDSPNIEAKIDKNGPADLSEIWLEVSGNGNTYTQQCTSFGSSNPRSCSFSPSLSGGNNYNINWNATDSVGNSNSGSWTFTVDTSYDGDSNPSFSVEDESNGIVLFNDDKDLTVDFGVADSTSETTVTCYVGGEDVDSFTVDTGSGDQEYTCEINHRSSEDYYDTSAEIYLAMEDEAGNTGESDSETVSFDVNPPSVTGLEIPIKAELYNSNFDVEFSAYDSASEVEEVEYYFDSSTSYGEGTAFEYSSDTDSYEIDTSSLSAGDHTLYVRARDEAERWSSPRTVDFSFDPDAVPEISLDVPGNVSVTAGQRKKFDVTIENTGELHISSIELSGSAEGVFSDSESISGLEPGESITVSLRIDTKASNIGQHKVQVSTDSPSMTEEIGLVVEANSEQRTRIDSDLSEHQSKLQEMESNVTNLRQKVSEDKKQRLDANFSTFKQKVEDAQSAVDRGDYYEADSILEGIEQDQSAAESTYEAVQKEYKNNQFWMFIFLGLGGFVVLGGGAIAALSYTDEVDFDIREYLEDLQEVQFDFDPSAFEKYTDKVKRAMEGKDTSDAEDFEWEGFENK